MTSAIDPDAYFGYGTVTIPIKYIPLSHVYAKFGVCATFLVLTWLSFGARAWTRLAIVRHWGWDDSAMLITLLFNSLFCVSIMISGSFLSEKSSLSAQLMTTTTALLIIAEATYIVTMTLLKIALCLFFLRIMASKVQRRIIYVIAFSSTIFGLAFFFYALLYCGAPLKARFYWEKKSLNLCASRVSILGMSYTHAIISSITDLTLAVLPIPMVLQTKITKQEKIIVCCIFTMATTGVIASLIRLKWIPNLASSAYDLFFDYELIAIWSVVEVGFGITAGCLAALRPLLKIIVRQYNSRFSSSGSGTGIHTRRWLLFGSRVSSRTPHTTSRGFSNTEKSNEVETDMTTLTHRPLKTVEAPDFLNITGNDSQEDLTKIGMPNEPHAVFNPTPKVGIPEKPFAGFNPTPKLDAPNEAFAGFNLTPRLDAPSEPSTDFSPTPNSNMAKELFKGFNKTRRLDEPEGAVQPYTVYNPTPKLEFKREASENPFDERSAEIEAPRPITAKVVNLVRNMESEQPPKTQPGPPEDAAEVDSEWFSGRNREEKERARKNLQRATWWPMPRTSIVEQDNPRTLEDGRAQLERDDGESYAS